MTRTTASQPGPATATTAATGTTSPTLSLRIAGTVASSTCRFTAAGVPVVDVVIHGTSLGRSPQVVVTISHRFAGSSASSAFAARAMAQRLKGQRIDVPVWAFVLKPNHIACLAYLSGQCPAHTPALATEPAPMATHRSPA